MRGSTTALLGFVACAALLTGCAPGTSPGPTSSAAEPTATPSPTLTPTSDQVPSDPSTWVVDYDRVADVEVGQSLATLAAAAGLTANNDSENCPPGYVKDPGFDAPAGAVGISLMELEARGQVVPDPAFTYASFGSRVIPTEVSPESPSTAAGIRIGSSEADLLAAYPGIATTLSRYDETMGFTTYAAGPVEGRYLVFQVGTAESGARTVFSVRSSTLDVVTDVCD